jgi:ABC-type dipeptide/oligopeptide/nickel transport system permease subunit
MQDAFWVVLFPALAIVLFVMAVNFAGDGIRDALDPKYRRSVH